MASAKFVVLQKLRAERDILFSECGLHTGVTKAMKVKKWTEVAALAQSVGLMQGKPWKYMRDTIWPNWRKRTIAKGMPGGFGQQSEHDELVLEILAKPEPPGLDGNSGQMHNIDDILDEAAFADTVYAERIEPRSKRKRLSAPVDTESKKKQRLDLQIETLKIKSYKMRLEALEIETRLGLPRSSYTVDLPHPSSHSSSSPPHNADDLFKTE